MTSRLKIQVGENEISFEGDPDDVAARFDALAEKLLLSPVSPARVSMAEEEPPERQAVAGSLEAKPKESGATASLPISNGAEEWSELPETKLDSKTLHRVFNKKGDRAVFRYQADELPDALLLAMYGHHYVIGEEQITAPALLGSVRESGLELDRADRPLAEREGLWRSVGERRGKRYGLTGAGAEHCEDLIGQYLDRLNLSPVALERFTGLEQDQ